MAFKFNRSGKEPISEINVTPFVDVMLVLLVIFMVTAPSEGIKQLIMGEFWRLWDYFQGQGLQK